jgi:hypothetical protein
MPKYTLPQVWQSDFSSHPLFAGYESVCREILGNGWPNLSVLNHLALKKNILNAKKLPIQFTEQEAPKGQRAYEAQIHQTGIVPTRTENWHDLLNACVWLTWPKLKAALNQVHYLQTHLDQVNDDSAQSLTNLRYDEFEPKKIDRPRRTRQSDAATLFDESGAILIGPDPRLAQWLIHHDWHRAFVIERHLWKSHRLLVVGHAVLEKTLNPYPGMIAKVLYQPYPACLPDQDLNIMIKSMDALLAQRWLNRAFVTPSDLFALPVMGVPGVDAKNDEEKYYTNEQVFRP